MLGWLIVSVLLIPNLGAYPGYEDIAEDRGHRGETPYSSPLRPLPFIFIERRAQHALHSSIFINCCTAVWRHTMCQRELFQPGHTGDLDESHPGHPQKRPLLPAPEEQQRTIHSGKRQSNRCCDWSQEKVLRHTATKYATPAVHFCTQCNTSAPYIVAGCQRNRWS